MTKLETVYKALYDNRKLEFTDELNNIIDYSNESVKALKVAKDNLLLAWDNKITVEEFERRNEANCIKGRKAFQSAFKSAKYINSMCEEFNCDKIFPEDLNEKMFREIANNMHEFTLKFIHGDEIGINDADVHFETILNAAIDKATGSLGAKTQQEPTMNLTISPEVATSVPDFQA